MLSYLLPSRYCESDRFHQMATEITAGQQPGYDQVAVIVNWLRYAIRFRPGSSDTPVSAVEVNARQEGVCRDLAHLGIALCRSLSIPARMVVGYLYRLEPMDLHAWFEAYVGGRWYTFDATQAELKGGYVAVGYGRDAAEAAGRAPCRPGPCSNRAGSPVREIYPARRRGCPEMRAANTLSTSPCDWSQCEGGLPVLPVNSCHRYPLFNTLLCKLDASSTQS